jgi:anti-sigma regulatory factor (Ser/Thr protein kinase)
VSVAQSIEIDRMARGIRVEQMAFTSCKSWDLTFTAEPEEVASLRRAIRSRLERWSLPHLADGAELCAGELIANVITHVGRGTPTTLSVSLVRGCLRVEVHDPDTRALPTLIRAEAESESGRGMALVDAIATRWGVELRPDSKVTWCELATESASTSGHPGGVGVMGLEGEQRPYAAAGRAAMPDRAGLSAVLAEETVIELVAGFCHWLRLRGFDVDHVLERAQTHYEAEIGVSVDAP